MNIQDILSNLKIESLNTMQRSSADAFHKGNDVILLSPTGTGKTLAYLIPLAESLKTDVEGVQAIILVPSRELALQTEQVFKEMGTPFRAMSCYGGRPAMEEHRTMNSLHPAVIIGTPGRMNDHLHKGNFDASMVRILVIDEFDKSLELGFQEEMQEVIGQLPALSQRFLLSATEAESIPHFTGLKRAIKLNFLQSKISPDERLLLFKVQSPQKDKLDTLFRLLCCVGEKSTLVFCNYRESVDRVVGYLQSMKIACAAFHGGMEQEDRERALYKFRNGSCPVLVSTDLAARGLDIDAVRNVIHYHLPSTEDGYIHRNGRTARWDAEGSAYILLGPEEMLPAYVKGEVSAFTFPVTLPAPPRPVFTTLYIGKGRKDKVNKVDILGYLCKKGGLTGEDIGRIDVKDHYAFAAVSYVKAKQILLRLENEKIKGLKTIIDIAR